MDAMTQWLETLIRGRFANRRGQADVVVALIILFLLWLIVTGRRVVVR